MTDALPSTVVPVRPPLRWLGGKHGLIRDYSRHLLSRDKFTVFHDAMTGGGAVPFEWAYGCDQLHLNDKLPEIVAYYTHARDDVEGLIEGASLPSERMIHAIRSDGIEAGREVFNETRGLLSDWRTQERPVLSTEAAVWMLVLNRTSTNGLHRMSRNGRCNMAIRKDLAQLVLREDLDLVRADGLRALHRLLPRANAMLTCGDFEVATACVQAGEYVFFDPPYDPNPKRLVKGKSAAGFTAYTADGFTEEDHQRLSDDLVRLDGIGAFFTLTARSTVETRARYAQWTTHEVDMRHGNSMKSSGREVVRELIVTNVGP